MATNPKHSILLAGALAALAGYAPFGAAAAGNAGATTSHDASTPLVLAQASAPGAAADRVAVPVRVYPAYQRGVREAAAQGPEALRRYIWRTRMIYNFYFPDFVQD
jgi:hypothetical protein